MKAAWAAEMAKLSAYSYDKDFEPIIKARYEKTIPEFIETFGSALTQTEALLKIRSLIAPDAVAVAASGSLPGDLQRLWTTDAKDSYNMEYGYSCMGYEVAGAFGSKLAKPGQEVYAFVGDGAFLMLGEQISARQMLGILLVFIGVWTTVRPKNTDEELIKDAD